MTTKASSSARATMVGWRVVTFIALAYVQSSAHGAHMNNPDIKLNPDPRMRYEITLHVDGAPGPFDRIEGIVDYRVSNEACVPLTPVTGATVAPETRARITLIPAGNNVYKGELFADRFKDEDYFGKGVCHWGLVAAGVDLYVKGVDFSASLFHEDLFKGRPMTRFYSNRSYATTHLDRVDAGQPRRELFGSEAAQTFSITLKAEEKRP